MAKIIPLKKFAYSIVISLFFLAIVQKSQARQAATIVFYITKSGMYAMVGTNDKEKPEKIFFMDQSTEPTLTNDPPTLIYTDSPVKFFYTFWEKCGKEIRLLLNDEIHKDMPVKVYIAAAGAALAKEMKEEIKRHDNTIVDYYLSSYLPAKADQCFTQPNKLKYFQCIFQLKIREQLAGKIVTTYDIVPDVDLITKAASLYYNQVKSVSNPQSEWVARSLVTQLTRSTIQKAPLLIGHITTDFDFYKVDDYRCDSQYSPLSVLNCFSDLKCFTVYQLGSDFNKKHLQPLINSEVMQPVTCQFEEQLAKQKIGLKHQIKLEQQKFEQLLYNYQQKHADHLLSAVYASEILHLAKHQDLNKPEPLYQGAPCMIYRLAKSNRYCYPPEQGCNLFGDLVQDVIRTKGCVAGTDKINKITKTCPQYLPAHAHAQAMTLADQSSQSLLEYITSMSLFRADPNDGNSEVTPLILIGDRISLLEQYAGAKGINLTEELLSSLTDVRKLDDLFREYKRIVLVKETAGPSQEYINKTAREQFQKDIEKKTIPLIKGMIMVPQEEFLGLIYQAALKSMRIQQNQTDYPCKKYEDESTAMDIS
ncbi:MAG: hypothetical protein OXC48_08100 [Endozoicomonadaceae bacterium]|nr:hypothetical protein [Endozoicomonadaceae bacterium]